MPFRSSSNSRQINAAARLASYKAEQVRLKRDAAERRASSAARAKAAEQASTGAPGDRS